MGLPLGSGLLSYQPLLFIPALLLIFIFETRSHQVAKYKKADLGLAILLSHPSRINAGIMGVYHHALAMFSFFVSSNGDPSCTYVMFCGFGAETANLSFYC